MVLYAISDIHVGHPENRAALEAMPAHPDDWLILCGDIGETARHLAYTLHVLRDRFARIIWVPGNHELWTVPGRETVRGQAKYEVQVEVCRHFDVLTPEDPYVVWQGEGGRHLLCPLFLLYDYTFVPDHVSPEQAVAWAQETSCTPTRTRRCRPGARPGSRCPSAAWRRPGRPTTARWC